MGVLYALLLKWLWGLEGKSVLDGLWVERFEEPPALGGKDCMEKVMEGSCKAVDTAEWPGKADEELVAIAGWWVTVLA